MGKSVMCPFLERKGLRGRAGMIAAAWVSGSGLCLVRAAGWARIEVLGTHALGVGWHGRCRGMCIPGSGQPWAGQALQCQQGPQDAASRIQNKKAR